MIELDAIRARDAASDDLFDDPSFCAVVRDRRDLLAEVDRLRARAVEDRERWVEQWQRALPVIEAARALVVEVTRGDDWHPDAEEVAIAAFRVALAEYDR